MDNFFGIVSNIKNYKEHSTYLEITSRLCYYNAPNLNNDMLPYDCDSLTIANTLVNMPVQAKYTTNKNGEPTFMGHEMTKSRDTGEVSFGTMSIGTHTEVYIKNDIVEINGEEVELPCLFAKFRVWKRYKNVVSAIKRLCKMGKLYSSWEIMTYKYKLDNGVKKILKYEFVANCLLGYEYTYPSYGKNANVINVAEHKTDNFEYLIAEALSKDLIDEAKEKEVIIKMNENTTSQSELKNINDINRDNFNEFELKENILSLMKHELEDEVWIVDIDTNNNEVWFDYKNKETNLDYLKVNYSYDENRNLKLLNKEIVKLTSSIRNINLQFDTLNNDILEMKKELEIKNKALNKASEYMQELKDKIKELTPYKEKYDEEEKMRLEKEIELEKETLRNKLLRSKLFSNEEINNEIVGNLIENRDEVAINKLIADKLVESLDTEEIKSNEIIKDEVSVVASIQTEDVETDIRSFMKKILL